MDPATFNQLSTALGPVTAGVVVVALVVMDRRRRADGAAPPANTQPTNGNGDKRFRQQLAEACQDCRKIEEIKAEFRELRQDFRGLERNWAVDIRGVHERLDRMIDKGGE